MNLSRNIRAEIPRNSTFRAISLCKLYSPIGRAVPGRLAESNAQQVRNARQIIEGLGLELATSDEAREILALKGGDKVGF